jgi:glycosyltransferase involved in cell wall biosynthesis
MKIALITDAWAPQVNGVVTTLVALCEYLREAGHHVQVIHPGLFKTRPCPGYPGIDLAWVTSQHIARHIDHSSFDAIHLATEGPLGWAARAYCQRRQLAFSSAYHTRFPELLQQAIGLPLGIGYALMRRFHRASSAVMVPTQGVLRVLEQRGFERLCAWTHGIDTEAFRFAPAPRLHPLLIGCERPIALYVGRISYEKNVNAFLSMEWPGSKVVCGVGPLEDKLRPTNKEVRWLGLLDRSTLADVYASADVFVLPSRHETFGLVLLEAMACGTPAAAYPVDGPMEVLGQPTQGGCLDEDLAQAARQALATPRHEARLRASQFSWAHAGESFLSHLVPAHRSEPYPAPLPVRQRTS